MHAATNRFRPSKRLSARVLGVLLALAMSAPAAASTCEPCYGGIDEAIAPCDTWQTLSGDNYGDSDRLFEFGAIAGVTYVFSFCEQGGSSGYDSSLSIFDASSGGCGALLACNDDWCGLSSRLEWTAPSDGAYVIRVGGFGDQTGSFTLAYRAVGAPCSGLDVSPGSGLSAVGTVGGPFDPAGVSYTLSNRSEIPLEYRIAKTQSWVVLDDGSGPSDGPIEGTLAPGAHTEVTVHVGPDAAALSSGAYTDTVSFLNLTDGDGNTSRTVALWVADPVTFVRSDLFIVGRDNSADDRPMLARMSREGAIVWERALPFPNLENMHDGRGSRNLEEDAFYLIVNEGNRVGGLARLLKYDAAGRLAWDLPIAPDLNWVSADPVHGGAYVSDGYLGVYRVTGEGQVAWGPSNWGYSQIWTPTWPVAADAMTGGVFTGVWDSGMVLKIEAAGELAWTRSVPEPARLDANPVDGGVYVGSGGYSHTTYRLDADGNVAWTKSCFPSCYTYPRTVSPVDGSLLVVSGWSSLIARAAMDGTVLWSVQNDDYNCHTWCNISLAADIEQEFFYGSQDCLDLGIDKRSLGDTSLIWRTDPGYYTAREGYGPKYHLYTGTPLPAGLSVTPHEDVRSAGPQGGPFEPAMREYTLTNHTDAPLDFRVSKTQPWVRLWLTWPDRPGDRDLVDPPDGSREGTLGPGGVVWATVEIGPDAAGLAPGSYSDTVTFTNLTDGQGNTTRGVSLRVRDPNLSCSPTKAWVSQQQVDQISVVDFASGSISVLATFPDPHPCWNPQDIAFSPDQTTLYSAGGSRNVCAIDAVTGAFAVIASDLGATGTGIGLDPSGAAAYVVGHENGTITRIDLGTFSRSVVASGLYYPLDVAISKDGQQAWVALYYDGVWRLDLTTGDATLVAQMTATPHSIVVSPEEDKAYVAALWAGEVQVVDLATGAVSVVLGEVPNPRGVTLSGDGSTLYVSASAAGELWALSLQTGEVVSYEGLAGAVSGVAVDCGPTVPDAVCPGTQTWECSGAGLAAGLLDGTASQDPDGLPLTYRWNSPTCSFADSTAPIASATCPMGSNVVTLVVNNGRRDSAPCTTTVEVRDTIPPTGRITYPAEGACIGMGGWPVVVRDDFEDLCSSEIEVIHVPNGGPTYATHGDWEVWAIATDPSGNSAEASVRFSLDLLEPEVQILSPVVRKTLLPGEAPFQVLFASSDDDGAAGGVVHEVVRLDGCLLYDGATWGDGDGLLSDEVLILTLEHLCEASARCGIAVLERPRLRVEAWDCGGNLGFDSHRFRGSLALRPGICPAPEAPPLVPVRTGPTTKMSTPQR